MPPIKLNCASGQRPFGDGWTNIDCNPKWNPDVVADCTSMPMFEDNSAEIIVSHHGAEHLTLGQSEAFFREAHRILMPGGSLLVFVPDLAALTHAWVEGRISDYIFCVNLHGAYMDNEADFHRWSFTKKSLTEHLKKAAPWRLVLPFGWRSIPGADLAKDWWVLAMEAIK